MTMTDWEAYHQAEREQALLSLRHHWGEAYELRLDGRVFHAKRRDNGLALPPAPDGETLDRFIRLDYHRNPVPRDFPVVR